MSSGFLPMSCSGAAVVLDIFDAAVFHGLQARDGLQQLLLAAAGDARYAQYLAGVGREGNVVQLHNAVHDLPHGEILYSQPGL
jgi:hypothetical protein